MFRVVWRALPRRSHFSSSSPSLSLAKHTSPLSQFSLSSAPRPCWAANKTMLSYVSGQGTFQEEQYTSRAKWIPYAVGGASLLALQMTSVYAEEDKHEKQAENAGAGEASNEHQNTEKKEKEKDEEKEKEKDDEIPKYDYVIIGGGMSCVSAMEAIRKNDKTGSILVINKEDHFPYERSPLSKGMWYKGRKSVPADVAEKLGDLYHFAGVDSRKVEDDFACTYLQNETVERVRGEGGGEGKRRIMEKIRGQKETVDRDMKVR